MFLSHFLVQTVHFNQKRNNTEEHKHELISHAHTLPLLPLKSFTKRKTPPTLLRAGSLNII